MLPRQFRMHRSTEFSAVVRLGARSRQGTLVVHHCRDLTATGHEPLVGLIVSKAVGSSVVRHRVSRRLRAQLTSRVATLPPGSGTVIRALPASGTAPSRRLARDLDRALLSLGGIARDRTSPDGTSPDGVSPGGTSPGRSR